MNNISEVLKASNSSFEHVVKCNVYITDFANFQKMNEVYGTYFKGEFPSRTCVAVRALPKNGKLSVISKRLLKSKQSQSKRIEEELCYYE
jgi:2-iminobutanoate/2-iminopropanoate deaminase